ncbi:methyltransferase [Candidatus Woesearchaeota archaeon]|nr:methyltransferase [Candidatus Woesearchaeota archaeon]
MNENPLISKQGFEYILSVLDKEYSKRTLDQLLDSLITDFPHKDYEINLPNKNKKRHKKIRLLRKQEQINGMLNIVDFLNPFNTIIEIASGNGLLASFLASKYPSTEIYGIDSNGELIRKLNNNNFSNLFFNKKDAFEYLPKNNPEIVLSLHSCGNLTDRVIDIAVSASSDIICTPCCYGKLKTTPEKEDYILPRSKSLSSYTDFFRKKIIKKSKKLEGYVNEGKRNVQNVLLDLYRVLLNFDRLLYLKEKGYKSYLTRITGQHITNQDNSRHANSSLRYAIVGLIK